MKNLPTRTLVVITCLSHISVSFVSPLTVIRCDEPSKRRGHWCVSGAAEEVVAAVPTCAYSRSPTTRRRILLNDVPSLVFFGATTATTIIGAATTTKDEAAAMMQQSSSQTTAVFELGKELTFEEAKGRFKEGQTSLGYLLDHYEEICTSKDGGGDNVRRYLGTVGTTSGLYGISKVMKTLLLSEIADDKDFDVVEFTEKMDEINSALMSADGSAYSTIFIVSSPNGEISEKAKRYFIEAKIEIIRAMEAMNDIAELMNIR